MTSSWVTWDGCMIWISPRLPHWPAVKTSSHPQLGFLICNIRVSRKESRICPNPKGDQPSDHFLARRKNRRGLFTSETLQKGLETWEFNWLYLPKWAEVIFIKYLTFQREHSCTNMSCRFEHKQSGNQILSPCCIPGQGDCQGFNSMYLYLITNTRHQGSRFRAEL